MCGIVGAIVSRPTSLLPALQANNIRGRDAWGYWADNSVTRDSENFGSSSWANGALQVNLSAIANLRAEPTTEYVKEMTHSDIQPYRVGKWVIVHNGTIANDKELNRRYGFKPPTRIDSWVIAALLDKYDEFESSNSMCFRRMLNEIVGSYAILAIHTDEPQVIHYGVNYRPLYRYKNQSVIMLSSVPLTDECTLLEPYTWGQIYRSGDFVHQIHMGSLYASDRGGKKRALVVYSGGLDSTVAARALQKDGYDITLLHFDYGCRATGPERQAVEAVARRLNVQLDVVKTSVFTDIIKGSRLTNTKDEKVAENEAGAEYAHEWVPARNTILLSIALGIAESRGFDAIALGANLEEAGAYPDNEPEFLRQFNKLIPFAVGDGKRIEILTPVGNLMKHEIVKLGLQIDAPMELSWSCYDANVVHVPAPESMADGEQTVYRHCGKCGPCFMRKTAFQINGAVDPVFRAEDASDTSGADQGNPV